MSDYNDDPDDPRLFPNQRMVTHDMYIITVARDQSARNREFREDLLATGHALWAGVSLVAAHGTAWGWAVSGRVTWWGDEHE